MTVFLFIVMAIVAFVFYIASRPGEFRVERSAVINAPAPVVFEQINNLRKWDNWSPWAKLDPNAKNTFEGPDAGVGAKQSWDGNNKVGAGAMGITESKPNEHVRLRLEFYRPMKAVNTTDFHFTPQGDQTKLAWAMSGRNNFMGKAIGLVMNCEKMVGKQFEEGLANLNAVVTAR